MESLRTPADSMFQTGDASITYGCLEPTMLTQMAKYLDTVYVSGWQCSSTASSTDEPSPDLADYPMVIDVLSKQRSGSEISIGHSSEQGASIVPGSALP